MRASTRSTLLVLLGATSLFLLSAMLLYGSTPELHTAHMTTRRVPPPPPLEAPLQTSQPGLLPLAKAQRKQGGDRLVEAERKLQTFHTTRHEPVAPVHDCHDENTNCKLWASQGECDANPVYMRNSCPVSCDACADIAKRAHRCHRTAAVPPLLRSGGVDATFRRLLQVLEPTHEVRVLSRPPTGPWVVTIEDFLAEHEIRAMVEKGGHHFERSLAGDGVSPVRTSKTSWCNVPLCEGDPTVRSIKARVANVTGVPLVNSEHVQVLQYDPGDFYRQHHDQNAHPDSPWGPRLFTFFLYLNRCERARRALGLGLGLPSSPPRLLASLPTLPYLPTLPPHSLLLTSHRSYSRLLIWQRRGGWRHALQPSQPNGRGEAGARAHVAVRVRRGPLRHPPRLRSPHDARGAHRDQGPEARRQHVAAPVRLPDGALGRM